MCFNDKHGNTCEGGGETVLPPVGLGGAMLHIASQQGRVYKCADKHVCMTRFHNLQGYKDGTWEGVL